MNQPKVIAGLHCHTVLEMLPDYASQDLTETQLEQLKAHLSQCKSCLIFGTKYVNLIQFLNTRPAPSQKNARDIAQQAMARFKNK